MPTKHIDRGAISIFRSASHALNSLALHAFPGKRAAYHKIARSSNFKYKYALENRAWTA
jgi:hypothetical protein